jgi:ribosomal protein S18 acetylase RimI-like enzyme
MSLRPFDVADAATVAGWARTAEEASMWCGHAGWPVPADKVAGWSTEDDVRAFGLYAEPVRRSASSRAEGDLIGYGELWVDDDEGEVELARLIIDPRHRGRGAGRELVAELVARSESPDIFLRVHPDNTVALRCYTGAGFIRGDAGREAEWNAPQPVAYVWLTRP